MLMRAGKGVGGVYDAVASYNWSVHSLMPWSARRHGNLLSNQSWPFKTRPESSNKHGNITPLSGNKIQQVISGPTPVGVQHKEKERRLQQNLIEGSGREVEEVSCLSFWRAVWFP